MGESSGLSPGKFWQIEMALLHSAIISIFSADAIFFSISTCDPIVFPSVTMNLSSAIIPSMLNPFWHSSTLNNADPRYLMTSSRLHPSFSRVSNAILRSLLILP